MEKITRFRARLLLLFFVAIIGFFIFKIYDLQIIQTGGNTDNSATSVSYTRVKAARGDILDRNGNLLVGNRASYDLVLNHTVLLTAEGTNKYLYDLTQRCLEMGIEYNENFPVTKERPFTYTLDEYSASWQGYFQSFLVYKGELDSDITAPLLIQTLREKYRIPAEWTDEEARLVIGIRYEMDLRGCVYSLSNYLFLSDAKDDALSAIVELNVPGMSVEPSTVREYYTTYAAHILGHVGAMTPAQWEQYKETGTYSMDAEVGQSGMEAAYEQYLHGIDGEREDTVAADGTLVRSVYSTEPQAGDNVSLSIDINLQMIAEDQLAKVIEELRAQEPEEDGSLEDGADAEGGAVVAIEVKTGQILACASYPTYDLSRFFEDYKIYEADPYKPFFNRALMAAYPPGSTYKMSMVVAGIDSGYVNSAWTSTDLGVFTKYQDEDDGAAPTCLYYMSTGKTKTHGTIDATVALQKSCNYFFYELGDMLPLSAIDNTAKGLGLGEPTGVELSENIGHRANAQTKAQLYDKDKSGWYAYDQIACSIGQSDNLFSPMQLGVYTATLANQGTRFKATFLNRVVADDYKSLTLESTPSILGQLEISDEAYNTVLKGMNMVAQEEGGTAYSTFRNYPIKVAAKTGTAQHGTPNASDNGAFVCFAPLDDPQIAIAIYIEKGGHGSTLATIAKSMLDYYFDVDEVGDVAIYENQVS